MAVIHARLEDARILVGNDRLLPQRLALDIAALLDQLRDFVATSMVNKDLARAHLPRKTAQVAKVAAEAERLGIRQSPRTKE